LQLSMVLTLAGAEAFGREEMTITMDDLKKGLHRLRPREVESYTMCKTAPSNQEKAELYHILVKSFGPGINMTKDAFALLRGVVYKWHRSKHVETSIEEDG